MAFRNPFRRAKPSESLTPDRVAPVSLDELVNNLTQNTPGRAYRPMPRDPSWGNLFGPQSPFAAQPLDEPRKDGGVDPRYSQYPATWNLQMSPNPRVPFRDLRDSSMNIDLVRVCMERRKRELAAREWGFTVAPWAVNREAARSGQPRQDIEARLMREYADDINKANDFWRFPGKNQDFDWSTWVYAAQEEFLSIDAWCVYPQKTYGGDLYSLDLIDGSTIKPLRDVRGGKPQAPFPAYQQILYGFPRGEFRATTVKLDGQKAIPNAYKRDQLYYMPRWGNVLGPFGMSAVEQALISARLYLKRQGWMLSEYDDGVIPRAWIESALAAGDFEMDAVQRRYWQNAINDELAGDTVLRQRLTMLPPGFHATETSNVDERYKPDYDLFLIKLLAAPFSVPITALGFSEAKGLGGSGWHEGQADNYERQAMVPDTHWFSSQISRISHEQLGVRPEVVHRFLGLDSEDEAAQDQVWENRVRSGRVTRNEDRARLNLPLFQFREADMPMLETTRGVVPLEGAADLVFPDQMLEPSEYSPSRPGKPAPGLPGGDRPDAPKPKPAQKAAELAALRKWLARHPDSRRHFACDHLTPDDAPDLNDPRIEWSEP